MSLFGSNRIVKRILHQLIIYHDLVQNIVYQKRFKRTVKSCPVVIPAKSFTNFIFRKRLPCIVNNSKDTLPATRDFKVMFMQNFVYIQNNEVLLMQQCCKYTPFFTINAVNLILLMP